MKYYLIRKNRETGRVWKAICEERNGKYVVKAGSIISNVELLGCPMLIQQIRRTAKINQNRILLEDVEFQTLDHAASFVLATNAIGKREFKTEYDMPLEKRILEFGNFGTQGVNDTKTEKNENQVSVSKEGFVAVETASWVDSIVEAMKLLGGDAHYSDLYPMVMKIRQNKGLSIPVSFEAVVRERIQYHSSDSEHFTGKDIFRKLGPGHWGLREEYKDIQTFGEKPIEDQNEQELVHAADIKFENPIDDIAVSQDGKQLGSIEETKLRKAHYTYEGRLKDSQIKRIKMEKGYVCEACGMSFSKKYPSIGDGFIECHHKIPYSDMTEGEKRNLNVNDFIVLCSNCHKMIHRLDNPADLDQLRAVLAKGSEA